MNTFTQKTQGHSTACFMPTHERIASPRENARSGREMLEPHGPPWRLGRDADVSLLTSSWTPRLSLLLGATLVCFGTLESAASPIARFKVAPDSVMESTYQIIKPGPGGPSTLLFSPPLTSEADARNYLGDGAFWSDSPAPGLPARFHMESDSLSNGKDFEMTVIGMKNWLTEALQAVTGIDVIDDLIELFHPRVTYDYDIRMTLEGPAGASGTIGMDATFDSLVNFSSSILIDGTPGYIPIFNEHPIDVGEYSSAIGVDLDFYRNGILVASWEASQKREKTSDDHVLKATMNSNSASRPLGTRSWGTRFGSPALRLSIPMPHSMAGQSRQGL